MFAAIYHPVGLAIVVAKWKNTGMRIAVNGVWGNLGVASAALITGYLIDNGGWRAAFIAAGRVLDPGRARLRLRCSGGEIAAEPRQRSGRDGGAAAVALRPDYRRCCCAFR